MKIIYSVIIVLILLISQVVNADDNKNLGIYGITLESQLYDVLDKAIDKGLKIEYIDGTLDPEFVNRIYQITPADEIDKVITSYPKQRLINPSFRDGLSNPELFNINTSLLDRNNKDRIDISDYRYYLYDNSNTDTLNFIPINLTSQDPYYQMYILFYNDNEYDNYLPLAFAITVSNKTGEMNDAVRDILDKRFKYTNRYWEKDNIRVDDGNRTGSNTFTFYNPDEVKKIAQKLSNMKKRDEQVKQNLEQETQNNKMRDLQKGM